MWPVFLFFVLLVPAKGKAAEAPPARRCPSLYASLYHETRSARYLTESDEKKLAEVRENPNFSSAQRARLVFDQVLEARLRNADPEIAEHVRESFRAGTLTIKPDVNGVYNPLFKRANVQVPQYLAESAVEYAFRIHELQHAFQHKYLNQRGVWFMRRGPLQIMLVESDAISLEWNFLRQIPAADRAALLELVKADGSMKELNKNVVIAQLEMAGAPFQEYIDRMREIGRYSKDSLKRESIQKNIVVGLGLVTLVTKFYMSHTQESAVPASPSPSAVR